MPKAQSIIIASIYIGKFVAPITGRHGRISRLTLSGVCANIVNQLMPICDYLEEQGYETLLMDGTTGKNRLPLKVAAVKAGLGWIGKNTLLISERYGSFRALGAILTDAVLHEQYDIAANRCGSCTKCMDACPTKAIQTPRQLTRSRCMAHIMRSSKGIISLENVDMQGYFRECDICQNACTWNQRHIEKPLDTQYGASYDVEKLEPLLRIERLETMDEDTYRSELLPWMGNASVPYYFFKRNVSIMMHSREAKRKRAQG